MTARIMDGGGKFRYFPNMNRPIPVFGLYGEGHTFPDVLHIERIVTRAALYDWTIAPHRHPDLHQFFHFERGAARMTVDGRSYDLPAGSVVNIPRRVVHGFVFATGTEGHVLTLPAAELPEAFEGPLAPRLGRWGVVRDALLAPLMQAILQRHGAGGAARVPLLRALAMQVACHVAEALEDAAPSLRDPRIATFEALVRQHFRDRWKVGDYASALAISPTHLNRLLRDATGEPASALIEAQQMREACRLLAYTRANVANVGYALGFEDPAYFSRCFRRRVGLSPGAYRRQVDAG